MLKKRRKKNPKEAVYVSTHHLITYLTQVITTHPCYLISLWSTPGCYSQIALWPLDGNTLYTLWWIYGEDGVEEYIRTYPIKTTSIHLPPKGPHSMLIAELLARAPLYTTLLSSFHCQILNSILFILCFPKKEKIKSNG